VDISPPRQTRDELDTLKRGTRQDIDFLPGRAERITKTSGAAFTAPNPQTNGPNSSPDQPRNSSRRIHSGRRSN
jgi:hypothetical protein